MIERHYIKGRERDYTFPFSFELRGYNNEKVVKDIEIIYEIGKDTKSYIVETIQSELTLNIDFNRYFNAYSEDYNKTEDLLYRVILQQKKGKTIVKIDNILVYNLKTKYSFVLVDSIKLLEDIFNKYSKLEEKHISFDLETTGLNPELNEIVGYSFSFSDRESYYVPLRHDKGNIESIEKALDLIYNALLEADIVYMFNSRFDMRFMEFESSKYDMVKIADKLRDGQVSCYFADNSTPFSKLGLKALEKHFLGIYRIDYKDVVGKNKVGNFAKLDPHNALFYASCDALTTRLLGLETEQYVLENKLSGVIDMSLLVPLMRMENMSMRINKDYLKEQYERVSKEIEEYEEYFRKELGNINLKSDDQREALFKSFNLDTQVYTKTGKMSTGEKQITDMIERMKASNEFIPEWLNYLGSYFKLNKSFSTYYGKLYEETENKDRLRFNYRNVNTTSGRLSSGSERQI